MTNVFPLSRTSDKAALIEELGYTVVSNEIVPKRAGVDDLTANRVPVSEFTFSTSDNGDSYVTDFFKEPVNSLETRLGKQKNTLDTLNNNIVEMTRRWDGRDPHDPPQHWTESIAAEKAMMIPMMMMVRMAATIRSVRSGNWSNPSTWSLGRIPQAGDVVLIADDHTVSHSISSTVKIKDIYIDPDATFRREDGSVLWVDTIFYRGTYWQGDWKTPVSGETDFYAQQAPEDSMRLGLVGDGKRRIHGIAKAEKLESDATISADAESVSLSMTGSNWAVGDKILFLATDDAGRHKFDDEPVIYGNAKRYKYTSESQLKGIPGHLNLVQKSHDEVRTITDIDGDTVSFDAPLSYAHEVISKTFTNGDGRTVTVKPVVANLTRSIVFRAPTAAEEPSYDLSDLQNRFHIMHMWNGNMQDAYAEIRNGGRTASNVSLFASGRIVWADLAETEELSNRNNVPGRYPWHIHRAGSFIQSQPAIAKGLSVWSDDTDLPMPGWGMTHHSSRAFIHDCVAYNGVGAGIVSEVGDEIGQWVGNVVAYMRGDGHQVLWEQRAENWDKHNGHAGIAYECQSRQVLMKDNYSSSCNIHWMYLQQKDENTPSVRVASQFDLRLFHPTVSGQDHILFPNGTDKDDDTYGLEQAQIPLWENNVGWGGQNFFNVQHRQSIGNIDNTPAIFMNPVAIDFRAPMFYENYTHNYHIYNGLFIGNSASGGVNGVTIQTRVNAMSVINSYFEDFYDPIVTSQGSFNYLGFICDNTYVNTITTVNRTYRTLNTGVASEHGLYNVNEEWDLLEDEYEGNPSQSRAAVYSTFNRDSSTDLPIPYPQPPWGPAALDPAPETLPHFEVLTDYDGEPCRFTLDADGGQGQLRIQGIIVDSARAGRYLSDRRVDGSGDFNNFDLPEPVTNKIAPDLLVERNGCYNDNGTWKMRLNFVDFDTMTGNRFNCPVDVTLTGFDTAFLEANEATPTEPELNLKPELVRFTT